jgi:hypothetical protein
MHRAQPPQKTGVNDARVTSIELTCTPVQSSETSTRSFILMGCAEEK